ncbi:MAG: hypothetical protein NUV57_02195 [archaeon]|nr:hypothetical protein [archaeon]
MVENKTPIAKFQAGNVSVSVWENDAKEGRHFKSVSIQKNYKIGEQWKSTNSLNINEIPKAILALQKAYEHLALKDELVAVTQIT